MKFWIYIFILSLQDAIETDKWKQPNNKKTSKQITMVELMGPIAKKMFCIKPTETQQDL